MQKYQGQTATPLYGGGVCFHHGNLPFFSCWQRLTQTQDPLALALAILHFRTAQCQLEVPRSVIYVYCDLRIVCTYHDCSGCSVGQWW